MLKSGEMVQRGVSLCMPLILQMQYFEPQPILKHVQSY